MSPSAIAPTLSNGNGRYQVVKPVPATKSTPEVHLSSADVIHLEHEHGAHNDECSTVQFRRPRSIGLARAKAQRQEHQHQQRV
ncbi:hypothetical protein DXG01_011083 [Tephrocybe rancida]|nr:hypothetical protein DXG01_011083 [Tephrocybe rancida]